MNTKKNLKLTSNNASFKHFTIFSISLFLLIMLLSAFFIVPKFNSLLDTQNEQDVQKELMLEAALFNQFLVNQQTIVQDLASYPSLAGAVMLGDANDIAITEFFDNSVMGGKKSRLVLQDIAGNIVIKTANTHYGNYAGSQPWFEQLLSGDIAYHFQLLGQKSGTFTFKVSVPVTYNAFIEGVLSSEISVMLKDAFVTQAFNSDVAFKLTQGSVSINTGTEHIEIHRENSLTLPGTDIVFTYITDDSAIYEGKRELQNTIFSVLLFGFAIAFLLFSVLNYRNLTRGENHYKTKQNPWKVYSIPIFVGVIGVVASLLAFMIASNISKAALEKELIFESKEKVKTITEKVELNLQILDAVDAFYRASNFISRQEFNTFVTPLLDKYKYIKAIEWVPYITHAQRDAYEQQARDDGISEFTLTEINTKGELVTAQVRESYFPVYYVEPILGNERAMGLDNGANNQRLTTIEKARKSAGKIATAKLNLVQATEVSADVLVFQAIFNKKKANSEAGEGPKLFGLGVLVLSVGDVIADTAMVEKGSLSIHAEDITDADNIESLYGSSIGESWFSRSETIAVAGRNWRINTYNNTTKTPLMLSAWLVLIVSLMLTGLITFGITHLIRRREVVEELVISRTARLIESEEKNRAVVENAVDGLLTFDEYGTVESFNRAAENIFGYSADEVLGENIKILEPESHHEEQDSYLKYYRDTGIKKNIATGHRIKGKRKDGSVFPIDLSISEMVLGKTRKLSCIVRDITDRVALEKERESFIEKLTDSNEELARFAFVCSHDLQEPLRMVRSFSEMLQEHLADSLKDDAKGQKYFNFVTDGAARAQTLITDILAYSSISNDTQALETVNLTSIINVIKNDLLAGESNKKGVITFDPLPVLQGNKTQLFQLFQNLISNGLKYQKPDATPLVHIGVEDSDSHWLFTFKDNGIGMEERHLTKIFEVFQRLHGRTKYAGTGVGLSICKKVVERHGGTIWVESEKNIGSTFYVKLLKPTPLEEV